MNVMTSLLVSIFQRITVKQTMSLVIHSSK
ncbi:unnamed protein product [Schistosoma mattheei]|uniref:Uncharacterized protein n=1 Tax=Schistosoma mattheei TaxID=31246 RepID=A0A183NK30_9TREM|nr:unnamed protein product [Schistosoma mattheei]